MYLWPYMTRPSDHLAAMKDQTPAIIQLGRWQHVAGFVRTSSDLSFMGYMGWWELMAV